MKNSSQMIGLYPIIRRVRRPLLPVDVAVDQVLPDGHKADAKPVVPPNDDKSATAAIDAGETRKETGGETDASEKAE